VVVDGDAVIITQESEELATVSAQCCLRALSHIAATDPTLHTIKRVRGRYTRTFPSTTIFDSLPTNHRLRAIHNIFHSSETTVQWKDYKLLDHDQIVLGHTLAELARKSTSESTENRWDSFLRGQGRIKVPRWVLRFALHGLSQDPPPPTSTVIDCLSIIAAELGCPINPGSQIPDESVRLEEISKLVTDTLVVMTDPCKIQSKRKAVTAFFPYAVRREREGSFAEIEAFLSAIKASSSTMSLWRPIMPFIPALFHAAAASPLTVLLTSPHVPWDDKDYESHAEAAVTIWAIAASAVSLDDPCPEEVEQRVVDSLLYIASVDALRPLIPRDTCSWLNRRPSLPPLCQGRSSAKTKHVVRWVRGLKDPEILTSYLALVWSEWDPIHPRVDLSEMRMTISRSFMGVNMRDHREYLIRHLDRVLKELDRGLGYFKQSKLWTNEDDIQLAKAQYGELMEKLLELDGREAVAGPVEVPMEIPI